jgi:hypothetical protein
MYSWGWLPPAAALAAAGAAAAMLSAGSLLLLVWFAGRRLLLGRSVLDTAASACTNSCCCGCCCAAAVRACQGGCLVSCCAGAVRKRLPRRTYRAKTQLPNIPADANSINCHAVLLAAVVSSVLCGGESPSAQFSQCSTDILLCWAGQAGGTDSHGKLATYPDAHLRCSVCDTVMRPSLASAHLGEVRITRHAERCGNFFIFCITADATTAELHQQLTTLSPASWANCFRSPQSRLNAPAQQIDTCHNAGVTVATGTGRRKGGDMVCTCDYIATNNRHRVQKCCADAQLTNIAGLQCVCNSGLAAHAWWAKWWRCLGL